MAYTETELAEELKSKKYEFGFVSNFESDKAPKGLNEDIIRLISAKKNEPEWLLDYRLKSFKFGKK
jgi:ABC-type transport system involved in Fe-S cluster assembly, permease component